MKIKKQSNTSKTRAYRCFLQFLCRLNDTTAIVRAGKQRVTSPSRQITRARKSYKPTAGAMSAGSSSGSLRISALICARHRHTTIVDRHSSACRPNKTIHKKKKKKRTCVKINQYVLQKKIKYTDQCENCWHLKMSEHVGGTTQRRGDAHVRRQRHQIVRPYHTPRFGRLQLLRTALCRCVDACMSNNAANNASKIGRRGD